MHRHRSTLTRLARLGATVMALSLVAAACGGNSSGEGGTGGNGPDKKGQDLTAEAGESGIKEAGEPKRGGKLIYGLEADSNGGFCLPEAQLAISGELVVRAVYDTLTVPNAKGNYVPYLAKSVEPNSDFTTWTIKLRPNIKFHDGSKLDATVVKNNIDAYRGKYPGRSGLLFTFVLKNIKDTKVIDDMTVEVDMEKPWPAFPAFLYGSSRVGIMAQKQLDSKDHCFDQLIGTGPFKFESWTPNQKLVAKANPDYWQTAPDGKAYPYASSIEFRPIPDGQVRRQALQAGSINIMHTSNSKDISTTWKQSRNAGKVNMLVSEVGAEVSFLQLNETKPPFDDLRARQALAMAADRERWNQIIGNDLPTIADGPLSPGSIGYVKDTGYPKENLDEAKKLVKKLKAEGKKLDFTISATPDPTVQQLAQLVQQRAKLAGINVKILTRDQAALISDAIGHNYQAQTFRNYPGGDPDLNYVWWSSGGKNDQGFASNPVNFGGFFDPEVDKLLDEGRVETDPAKRATIYQDLDKRMATQVHGGWAWFTPWAVVEEKNVHDILGPPLPGDDPSKAGPASTDDESRQPSRQMANGHSLLGLWVAS